MRIRTASSILATSVAVCAAAVVSGCGGSEGAKPAASPPKTTEVTFGEYFYAPKRVEVSVGDSVRFVNVGKVEHTVADSTKSGTIKSAVIQPRPLKTGQSQTVRFRKPGTVYYVCTFHPALMRGVVVVR